MGRFQRLTLLRTFRAGLMPAHGYSMLRPTMNVDYFHALYDEAKAFGIEIECHRASFGPAGLAENGQC